MRSELHRNRIAIAVGLAIAASPASALAQSPEFRVAYQAGQDAVHDGDYDTARTQMETARDLAPLLPGPHRWLAAIAEKQDRFEACLESAALAIKLNPDSRNVPDVAAIHARCRKGLGRPAFRGELDAASGVLAVEANVSGAVVTVNGLRYGATPFEPRALAVGNVTVTLERLGYLPRSVDVEIIHQIVTDVIVELERDPDASDGDGVTAPSAVEVGWIKLNVSPPDAAITFDGEPATLDARGRIEAAPGVYEVTADAPGHDAWRRRVRVVVGQQRDLHIELVDTETRRGQLRRGVVFGGAAVALAVAGTAFGLLENAAYEDAEDIWFAERQRPPGTALAQTGAFEPVRTRDDLADARDRGRRYTILSAASFGLAGVAAGVSMYYLVTARTERAGEPLSDAPAVSVSPLAPSERGVGAVFVYTRELW